MEDEIKKDIHIALARLQLVFAGLENWRGLYNQRWAISKRSGDNQSASLAAAHSDRILGLVGRTLTIRKKLEELQKAFTDADKEING